MNKIIFLINLFLLSSIMVICQERKVSSVLRADLIKKQLIQNDLKKFEALELDEKDALKVMQISDQNYEEHGSLNQVIESEKDVKKREKMLKKAIKIETKAIKNRVYALKSYHEVYVQRYKLYKSDLKKFFNTAQSDQIDSAKIFEKMAYDAFESAELDIQKVYYTINQTDLFKSFTRAYQSEQLGLLYQEKMYSIFLNWDGVTKSAVEKEIESTMQIKPMEYAYNQNDTIIVKDSIAIKTIYVYDTIKVEKIVDEVIYKVQIAASKKQLSIYQLRQIYPEDKLIQTEIENGWYKYSVGHFTHYKDAQRFKMNTGIPDAFIVAYKNGKKTPLSELVNHPSYYALLEETILNLQDVEKQDVAIKNHISENQ